MSSFQVYFSKPTVYLAWWDSDWRRARVKLRFYPAFEHCIGIGSYSCRILRSLFTHTQANWWQPCHTSLQPLTGNSSKQQSSQAFPIFSWMWMVLIWVAICRVDFSWRNLRSSWHRLSWRCFFFGDRTLVPLPSELMTFWWRLPSTSVSLDLCRVDFSV